MTDLRIARLRKRYRVSRGDTSARARLDKLLAGVMRDGLLDAALERAGISATDDVCIRHVDLLLRDATVPDSRLAVSWSVAIANAIADRLREGGPNVIRYTSRHQALADMSCRASHGDFTHAWAWRRLGIWRAGDFLSEAAVAAEILRALTRESQAAIGVLRTVSNAGRLPALLKAPPDVWTSLAKQALVSAGANQDVADALHPIASVGGDVAEPIVARIADESVVFRAILRATATRDVSPETIQSLATIALLEHEPAIATTAKLRPVIQRLTGVLCEAHHVAESPPGIRPATDARQSRKSDDRKRQDSPSPRSTHEVTGDPTEQRRIGNTTRAGGLLFLLHLVHSLELPRVVAADQALAMRPLRWVLYQLGLDLAEIAANDPAALAFAGLSPGSAMPARDAPLPSEDEHASIAALRETVVGALRERLGAPAEETDAALLRRVTTRSAEIIADPAWLEIRMSLSEVSTDIRRAGLDLDLGWLPWLGAVVRFVYA